MTEMIRIDSRVTGFSDQPVWLMAICFQYTGEILLQKTEIFTALAVPPDLRSNTVVVTDSPGLIKNWQLKFDSGALDNGHIVALLAIWASHKIATGYGVMSNQEQKEDDIDRTMLPFSI